MFSKKLGLGEVKPTTLLLQLASRSITNPRGLIEDVLIKVDKFVFLAIFIVLDMEEGEEMPLILGKPIMLQERPSSMFMENKLILRVGD